MSENATQLGGCLPGIRLALGLSPSYTPSMVVQACNHGSWKQEDQEFEASLRYIDPI